jgi:hypothetical protein
MSSNNIKCNTTLKAKSSAVLSIFATLLLPISVNDNIHILQDYIDGI